MKKNKTPKKLLALLLLAVMLIGALSACKGKDKTDDGGNPQNPSVGDQTDNDNSQTDDNDADTDNQPADDGEYTLNLTETTSAVHTLNPHEWEYSPEDAVMQLTQSGLYSIIYSETEDFAYSCEMAADFPTDVTSEYAGNETYGIPADATEGYAFRIPLRQDAKWEDGTPINADTYIYSYQQLLSPEMVNYRASSRYEGTYALANAYQYFLGGADQYIDYFNAETGEYAEVKDGNLYFSATEPTAFFGMSLADAAAGDYADYFTAEDGTDTLAALQTLQGDEAWIPVDDTVRTALDAMIAAVNAHTETEAYDQEYLEFCTYKEEMEAVTWDQVGLVKNDDYTLTFIYTKPIREQFMLYSGFTTPLLVKEDIYEANKSDIGGLTKTTYGTSASTYASYGPYKLTEWQAEKVLTVEKNDQWFGWNDPAHEGQYQATRISYQFIDEHTTEMQLFLQGNVDTVTLDANDIQTYGTSDYVVYEPTSYTFKLSFNTDKESLKARESAGVNKTLITYVDFRKAFSLAINRAELCQTAFPTHSAAYGLLNDMYVYETNNFSTYRDTEQAKAVLCEVYDSENYDTLSGYNVKEASELLEKAYQEALAAGDIKETDKVVLDFNVSVSSDANQKAINFLNDAIIAAAVGTSLEGRISIELKEVDDYYAAMKAGTADLIFSAWGGNEIDPYALMQCYVDIVYFDDGEHGFNAEHPLTIQIDGKDYTYSLYEWYKEVCEGQWAQADSDTRLHILAKLEGGILEQYCGIPLYSRREANLLSQKVQYVTDEFSNVYGYGGIRFMKFLYNDEEWAAYCAEQNNQLSY